MRTNINAFEENVTMFNIQKKLNDNGSVKK